MTDQTDSQKPTINEASAPATEGAVKKPVKSQKEYGGREGLEPTRYGDWENKGIISDF